MGDILHTKYDRQSIAYNHLWFVLMIFYARTFAMWLYDEWVDCLFFVVCKCAVHGKCDDGMDGSGNCFCDEGWTGNYCESKLGNGCPSKHNSSVRIQDILLPGIKWGGFFYRVLFFFRTDQTPLIECFLFVLLSDREQASLLPRLSSKCCVPSWQPVWMSEPLWGGWSELHRLVYSNLN